MAHRRGLLVNAWTVNEAPVARRLLEGDVDGITTDSPASLMPLREGSRKSRDTG